MSRAPASYGAGLTRHLSRRRSHSGRGGPAEPAASPPAGKTDPQDAINAARAAQSGDAAGAAKTQDGNVEAMRVLRVARGSARTARTQALNQMRQLISTAPERSSSRLRDLHRPAARAAPRALPTRRQRRCHRGHEAGAADPGPPGPRARGRDRPSSTPSSAARRRDRPGAGRRLGVGTDSAGALLVAAGDNPERLRNEATFAQLCGVAPIDASSGKQQRHRLNRGGDRQANSALWHIVITRMVNDPDTRDYIERRDTEGRTKKEAFRCLKRYIAREVFPLLPHETPA